jgi:hypothetical protein
MEQSDVEAIRSSLAKGFEADLFEATLRNLDDKTNQLRFNNFAYAARELMRHVLDRLAPDAEVLKCQWYENETDKDGGISRRQRCYYAVQGGLSDEFVKESLELEVDQFHSALTKAHGALNKYTHVGPETFGINDVAVDTLAWQTLHAFRELLDTIGECRKRILERFEGEIDNAAVDEVLSDSLLGIDELANHFSVQNVSVGTVRVKGIDHERVHIEASGSVECILQYGSNSDLRRGDGAEIEQSFKFTCQLYCPVDEPEELSVVEESVGVDTKAFHDARYGLDEYEPPHEDDDDY